MKILVLLLLMIATSVMCGEVALRATAAKGMLTCGPMKPYEGAKVRLYRINSKGNTLISICHCFDWYL